MGAKIGAGVQQDEQREFEEFFAAVELPLRHALVARYGYDRGREATAEALGWAWQNRSRLEELRNPIAFLYRVGQSRTRGRRRRTLVERPGSGEVVVEPGLEKALQGLPERQRVALLLVDGAGWTHGEVAELLGIRPSTVQTHVERGRTHLRKQLKAGVE
jgi:DNA-directed RNA polymerase specialized sigma24 family protein